MTHLCWSALTGFGYYPLLPKRSAELDAGTSFFNFLSSFWTFSTTASVSFSGFPNTVPVRESSINGCSELTGGGILTSTGNKSGNLSSSSALLILVEICFWKAFDSSAAHQSFVHRFGHNTRSI